ncbi:hypothetical protein [Dyadobacter frigoris]|uniref:TerB family tellurite resistance protein n=1 Tax=Dyadobacter frigoris TaxID=2576211 RepID=A0A4V6BHW9_9BACT|nr:hypothetical protein [Dyadobacter frigoris]TKT86013.1 hypothetical protein FDK13_32970 [Dyadobacter frigoris]
MKKGLIILAFLLISNTGYCQKFKEWFRQKKTQKQYLIEQIAQLKIYLELTKKGYKIAKEGLTTIGDIRRGEFKLHKNRFDSLSIVKPAISKHPVASAAVYQIVYTIRLYYQLGDLLAANDWLSSQEKRYIKSVFDQLAWDGVDVLDNLDEVTKDRKLKMTDDARVQRIEMLYRQSQQIYLFARQIFEQATTLSTQRRSEQDNIDNSRALHGIN